MGDVQYHLGWCNSLCYHGASLPTKRGVLRSPAFEVVALAADSRVKSKFGDSVRSKSNTGMMSEVLAKVTCHSIRVLVQTIHELGIRPNCCAQLGLTQELA